MRRFFCIGLAAVAAGGIYLDPAMTSRVADGLLAAKVQVRTETGAKLTERESEVLRLVGRDLDRAAVPQPAGRRGMTLSAAE